MRQRCAPINHVNLNILKKTIETFSSGPEKAVKEFSVEGELGFRRGGPQFRANAPFENGTTLLEMDNLTPMGDGGKAPNPLQCCLFGLASCFASTYMMVATQKGVAIEKLSVKVERYRRVDIWYLAPVRW